jgi:hypothetical protein
MYASISVGKTFSFACVNVYKGVSSIKFANISSTDKYSDLPENTAVTIYRRGDHPLYASPRLLPVGFAQLVI